MRLIDGTPITGTRQVLTDLNYFREQMPSQLMKRPGYGSVGVKTLLELNSHHVTQAPQATVYQYDVSQRGI